MFAWRHAGFSAHNEVRVPAEDAERKKKLAGYMLRAPMSLEKMTYDLWGANCEIGTAPWLSACRVTMVDPVLCEFINSNASRPRSAALRRLVGLITCDPCAICFSWPSTCWSLL